MEQKQLKDSIENILDTSQVGTMATVRNEKPFSRYMTFYHKGLKLYTATHKKTDKIEELKSNPYTHILIGYEHEGFGDDFVVYEGKVKLDDSSDIKSKLWNEQMKIWFKGPEDPDLIIIEIEPIKISLMNKKNQTPQTLDM